jgi:hypothetical protein
MLGFLPPTVRGVIALLLLALNTLFWCALLFTLALVKLALPVDAVQRRIGPLLNAIATLWVACNSAWMRLTQRTAWDVSGAADLHYEGWYLVNANHQSWVDIFALQPVAEVLSQAATHLRAGDRHRLVGAGLPFHATPLEGSPAQAS